jgi:hypothetical protein
MLTGRVPFESDTTLGFVRKHLTEPPPPFQTVNPDLARLVQLESVVMKALEKDRDQRYGSVLDFVSEFVQAAKPGAVATSSNFATPPIPWDRAPEGAAGAAAEADGPGVAVQTPPAPLATQQSTPATAPATEQASAHATPPRTHSSHFRAPRGPSVNLEKYDKLFSESDGRTQRYRVRVVFLGVIMVLGAAIWGLRYTVRRQQAPRMLSGTAPPVVGTNPQEPAQALAPPGVPSPDQWRKFAEEQKEKGLQEAQRIIGEVGGPSSQGPKVIFEPSEARHWDRPLKPGDLVAADYIDGGLQLEASPLPPSLIARAAKGSTIRVQLDVESNGTVHKGHRLDGDKNVADGLIQAAKQTWRFSPPVTNGVPVRTRAAVVVQF